MKATQRFLEIGIIFLLVMYNNQLEDGNMIKRSVLLKFIFLLIVLVIGSIVVYMNNFFKPIIPLEYDYNQSIHNQFYFEDNYVVFDTIVSIKNNTSKDLRFFMYADVTEDKGLVLENAAYACKKESLEKESFFIKANSVQSYVVYFKVRKGTENVKQNRLPPIKVSFEII